jgi:hypothetical protein
MIGPAESTDAPTLASIATRRIPQMSDVFSWRTSQNTYSTHFMDKRTRERDQEHLLPAPYPSSKGSSKGAAASRAVRHPLPCW